VGFLYVKRKSIKGFLPLILSSLEKICTAKVHVYPKKHTGGDALELSRAIPVRNAKKTTV
jgi:hypothetical protein